ncbi:MAG: hypothetical protein ABI197_07200 [Granulicella sp.]
MGSKLVPRLKQGGHEALAASQFIPAAPA